MPGPLQVIAASFRAAADFEGRVLAEVGRLQGRGMLRLVDLLLVAKNQNGQIQRLVVGSDEDFGALLSRIIPIDGAALAGPAAGEDSPGFDPSDALALAESLPPGEMLALLLVEHNWAQPLFDAIADTGGALLGGGFLTSEAGSLAGAEVAAAEEAAEVIAAAQAAEARAVLRAMTAEAEAAQAIAASEAIRAAAGADAIAALIAAGIVEEAAAHEAVEALSAAGVTVAVADEAAADAAIAASISMAEARVLRYLPTPLTFALIAGKLGISRSAAKERAERAYQKLGVHSRAEAVNRARALGLIG